MNFLGQLFGSPIPAISAVELQEKLKSASRPMVLDVREPVEFREGHIAGAVLIPLGELQRRVSELSKDKEIVCVCASGSRSSTAVRQLVAAGYQVFNMRGGMFAWQRAGLPIKKNA